MHQTTTLHDENDKLKMIADSCNQFIYESCGFPLLKNLPTNYDDLHRVKVRQRKLNDDVDHRFNQAFGEEHYKLRQRAVFANGVTSFIPSTEKDQEPFFIFPINGYKFMYSKEVENSTVSYKQVFDTLHDQFGTDKGNQVIIDLLKFTYTQENLAEGIESGAEIIIYNIPWFFALRATTVLDYDQTISCIEKYVQQLTI